MCVPRLFRDKNFSTIFPILKMVVFLEILSDGAIFDKLRICSSNEGGHFVFF